MYFVYILYSESQNLYYKGFTENVKSRVEEHNAGKSRYTCNKGPWKLIFVQRFSSKRDALIREKSLKRGKAEYYQWLCAQEVNIVKEFV
jgi:putative endonuclease